MMNTSQAASSFPMRANYGRPTSSPSKSSQTLATSSQTFRLVAGLLVLSIVLGPVQSFVMGSRPLSKRSFFDIQCKGVYDKGIFAKLDRICDDCYNMYREPQLHSLCSQNCFSSPYFMACLDALTLSDEQKTYESYIERIHAPTPVESNCFGSPFFKGCLDALLLGEEEGKFDEMIEILGKKKK